MTDKNKLFSVLEQIERDRNIKKEDIFAVVENALVAAYKKQVGKNSNVIAKINAETGEMQTIVTKTIVQNVKNPVLEISLSEAKKINAKSEIGADIKITVDAQEFSRIAAQTAKQVIVQKVRESERDFLFAEMREKIGQLVNGIIYRISNRTIIVDLGTTEAILPASEQIPKEEFKIGQNIRAVITKVDKTQKGISVVLSRATTSIVKKLFEIEVPEIYDKVVTILNVVRDPGVRTKLSVTSSNPKVDPVGACVGIKGTRVKPIIDELRGERVDLIPYSLDPLKFIASALSPAKSVVVNIVSKDSKKSEAIVPDNILSLAIGQGGHNVRLAAKLTGWNIDVKSLSQKNAEAKSKSVNAGKETMQKNDSKNNIENQSQPLAIKGIGPKTLEILKTSGYDSVEKLARATSEELSALSGIGTKSADKVMLCVKKILNT
ncbi:MAG: transcription termination factor NusA [Elusimicrobiota bacterium]|jgi:N utilization substance protein A|nr:transcription termination factor NusA [Elusimicrobiota bacterium]